MVKRQSCIWVIQNFFRNLLKRLRPLNWARRWQALIAWLVTFSSRSTTFGGGCVSQSPNVGRLKGPRGGSINTCQNEAAAVILIYITKDRWKTVNDHVQSKPFSILSTVLCLFFLSHSELTI